jgi:IS30 family transposase
MTIVRELASEGTALSPETIYKAVYAKGERGLERGLYVHLHRHRRNRRPRRHRAAVLARQPSPLGDFSLIGLRPEIAWARTEIGHFEGDLILGAHNSSAVVTLVDRASRLNLLGSLPNGHDAGEVLTRLVTMFEQLPPKHRKTLTWDQGREMARWRTLEETVDLPVFFCEPHHPWQRPSNEAFNWLVRRWLPKGSDLDLHDQDQLDAISLQINHMPRRSLNWQTAAECYTALALH